jgi:D-tyrosyl-tRNA(Tyr) deacylase
MRLLVQRVKEARVEVEDKIVGSIGSGLLVLFGAHKDDQPQQIPWLAEKLTHLRIFEDSQGKMNLSLLDVKGSVLIVSQFTLYGDCREGRRPSFSDAAPPPFALSLYESFVKAVKKNISHVETGVFGAYMQVHLINDGPVTVLIDSPTVVA